MRKPAAIALSAIWAIGATGLAPLGELRADGFNPMNMVNPSNWFGDRYDDDYYYGDRYGPPPGYFGGPYGAPYGVPYGAPYGAPGYPPGGAYAPGGYYAPAPAQSAVPAAPSDGSAGRIEELEERIRQLEAERRAAASRPAPAYEPPATTGSTPSYTPPPSAPGYTPSPSIRSNAVYDPAAPVFRPD